MTFDELKSLNQITAEVTQAGIDTGIQASCQNCPIARALEISLGLTQSDISVEVGWSCVHLSSRCPYTSVKFRHTNESQEFMRTFDERGKSAVKPSVFIFERIKE